MHTHAKRAQWCCCGGLHQLLFRLFSISLCPPPLFFCIPLVYCTTDPHQLSPHTHTHTHIHISTSQSTEGCVYFWYSSPDCMESGLSPLPLSSSPSFLSLSSCSLLSPQRPSSCWSSLRCSGKSIVCVCLCVFIQADVSLDRCMHPSLFRSPVISLLLTFPKH